MLGLLGGCLEKLPYLGPKSMQNHSLYGYYYGFRAIILHTFEVQVQVHMTI